MPLLTGVPAPAFIARSHTRPDFAFGSLGGLFVLLAFLPEPGPERDAAIAALRAHRHLLDDRNWCAFGVVRDEADFNALTPELPGLRYFHDPDGEIAASFSLRRDDGATVPQWVVVDPSMRIFGNFPITAVREVFGGVAGWREAEAHAATPLHAPVLIVPRVFDTAFCKRLIDVYVKDGGGVSGVMRDVGGKTVGVVDDFKKRRDAHVHDVAMQREIQRMIRARLMPEIAKAFMFEVTRMERYLVARYDAKDGGYFRAHRDNTTLATAHRQFACSINLNAEEFEGGDLRFPEFGRRTYRPPTGGAVIFSCALLHEATPVTSGTRFAFLPFFYNEAAAAIREANRPALEQAPVPAEV